MLFNSYVYILLFLPVTVLVYWALRRRGRTRAALWWLTAASVFFYGWWDVRFVSVLLLSMAVNYAVAGALIRRPLKPVLVAGIAFNLGLLGWFKYAGFIAVTLNAAGVAVGVPSVVLPLAISFFTFQQIAYLVDAWRGLTRDHDLIRYILFVTYFPQLIAGPIVHHAEMMPQFAHLPKAGERARDIAVGITILFIGLFKKVVLADGVSVYATPVFNAAAGDFEPTFLEAWVAALAYTFQLYFDFSGYSDMAIGAARLFGIRLPINFNSPYKAATIIEFWSRWHMTLSRFLRDYLYIPLGGNRQGPGRRYVNLMLTMLLGGLWHGAGWTFVAWGALHGSYLAVSHLWRSWRRRPEPPAGWRRRPEPAGWRRRPEPAGWRRLPGIALTFLAVVIAWVPFRAASFDAAARILAGMAGLNGVVLPEVYQARLGPLADPVAHAGVTFGAPEFYTGTGQLAHLAALAAVVFLLPNTQEWLARVRPALGWDRFTPVHPVPRGLAWRPNAAWAVLIVAAAAVSFSRMTGVSEFLYFQF
ncbi:MAG TPA: MBOAT family protein [Azospirillaceae bacterium]|nr:MBOAT family protein [Azospirillaceae bacterium]